MQLFEVIRWGNDSDDPLTGGPNGPDTCFLVRADSVEQAAALVDPVLAANRVEPSHAGAVYLLGADAGAAPDARILRGPYVQHAYRHGWRHWDRAAPGESWIERTGD